MSDWLLPPILIATAVVVYISAHDRDWVRAAARFYMLVVFTLAGLSTLNVIALDISTRIFLLRCGWLAFVLVEIILWVKQIRWSRKAAGRYVK